MHGAWPAAVFDAPLLRDLDAASRHALEAAGTIRDVAAGTRLYREGDDADTFFVVLAGRVALRSIRRGDAEAAVVREASAGDSFGEEASLQLQRRLAATVIEDTRVVELPASVFRRGAGRSGGSILARREERMLARAVTADLLRTMALTRDLPREDFDMVLDAVALRTCERGERIYGAGDRSDDAFFVAEGLIQIQDESDDEVAVVAYLDRGDLFGDEDALAFSPRGTAAVSLGFSALLRVPAGVLRSVVDRNAGLLARARRLAEDRAERQQRIVGEAAALTTQHVFKDVYRLKMARSLLVIDQDACVRCGHCAWSCSSTHGGVARLQRRGDKVVTRLAEGASTRRSLLVPNSCQHCKNPACMIDCPTGAIGRDPHGEVFIREDLCTGCGACAKACPWENIAMAPRASGLAALSATVAVKCDLCRDYDAPTCVRSCPTGALQRLDPNRDVAEVVDLLGSDVAPRREASVGARLFGIVASSTMPFLAAVILGLGIAGYRLQSEGGWQPGVGFGALAGWTGAAAAFGAALYAIPKRIPRMLVARRRKQSAARRMFAAENVRAPRSLLRPLFGTHVVVGCLALAGALAHAGARMSGLAGVLYGAFVLSAALGIVGALLYAFVPPALTRLERDGALPEDLRGRKGILVDDLFRQVSGRSDVLKALLDRVLLPYLRAPLGGLRLLASGRTLAQERARVRTRIDRLLEGRGGERLRGLDAAIGTAVELRALGPRRVLSLALRVWLVPHILVSTASLVLLVAHVLVMSGWP
jgi:Fe-S-cluster-containing dehydrogenase component